MDYVRLQEGQREARLASDLAHRDAAFDAWRQQLLQPDGSAASVTSSAAAVLATPPVLLEVQLALTDVCACGVVDVVGPAVTGRGRGKGGVRRMRMLVACSADGQLAGLHLQSSPAGAQTATALSLDLGVLHCGCDLQRCR
jgi:hypothetical protein